MFIGAGRALLMQLAHPWVATAIADHSSALSDPIGRFHRTFEIVFTMVFGSLDQALETSRRLHQRHASIQGVIPEPTGSHTAGSGYFATEVSALMWVHATLVDTALTAFSLASEGRGPSGSCDGAPCQPPAMMIVREACGYRGGKRPPPTSIPRSRHRHKYEMGERLR